MGYEYNEMGWLGRDWEDLERAGTSFAPHLQLLVLVKRYQFLQYVLQQTSESTIFLMVGMISILLTSYDES